MRTLALSLVLVSVLSACTMPGAKTPAETSTGMVETTTGVTAEVVTPATETTVSAEATTATAATVEVVTPATETTVSTGTAQ